MTLLSKVTNEQIRDNLRERYQKNIIYVTKFSKKKFGVNIFFFSIKDKYWRCIDFYESL